MINVCYSSSDSYAWIMTVSIVSLIKNNEFENLHIFILDNGINEINKKKIISLCSTNVIIDFIDITNLRSITGGIKINNRWDFATFGRLFEADLLPIDVDKVIHIDCDTVVVNSIKELWNLDMENKAVAGVKDCLSKHYNDSIHTSRDNVLFNAGLLIFNLKYIRDKNIISKFKECIMKSKRLMYLDQDVLNKCLSKEEKIVLSPKYNFYSILAYCNYKDILRCRNPFNFYSEDEISYAKENVTVIHFTSSSFDFGRPWHENNSHPFKSVFLKYLSISPFSDQNLLKCSKSKLIILQKKIPNFFSLFIARVLNSYLKPVFKKNK